MLNQSIGWLRDWLMPKLVRHTTIRFVTISSLLAVFYWGVIASDRYVSEAHIIIQRTDIAKGSQMDIGALLSFTSGGGNRTDQLLVRDYLLSVDMLNKLDSKLNLRAHYSGWNRDPLSKLWSASEPQEEFHKYYLSRISVELDDYVGVLVIKAQAYEPKIAQAITIMLVEEGELFLNNLAHKLALEQVAFVETQVNNAALHLQKTRDAILKYQNLKGVVSPQSSAENLMGTINQLESQRADLQTRRSSLLGYLSSQAPGVVELDMQIEAIGKQIKKVQSRLTSPAGKTLNSTVEEFQRLEMASSFAQDVYKTSLVALEQSRIEATRILKKVSILQSPTLPEYPIEPRRIYNIIVFILTALLLAGISHLLAAIVRDHKD